MVLDTKDAAGEWSAFEQAHEKARDTNKPSTNFADVAAAAAISQHSGDTLVKKASVAGASMSRRRSGDSSNPAALSSWMHRPINSDASWAPIAPPEVRSNDNASTRKERRPPRRVGAPPTRSSSSAYGVAVGRPKPGGAHPNPVTSSDSSASSADRARTSNRGRSSERRTTALRSESKPHSSSNKVRGRSSSQGRGRSRTRNASEPGVPSSAPAKDRAKSRDRSKSRGRSSSRKRVTPKERDRSASATRRVNSSVASINSSDQRRGRGGSRPPPTSSNRRGRSSSRTPVTRARSISRSRTSTMRPPPSTSRTRREMRTISGSISVGPGLAPRRMNSSSASVDDEQGSLRSVDANIGRDISFGRTKSTRSISASTTTSKQRSAIMEKLFGDQVSEEARQAYLPKHEPSPTASVSSGISWQQPEQIHSRILLTATVYHNTASNLWIATINTNQKGVAKNPATASKYLKAFSFASEKEARESAIANAPPKMIPFEESPSCFICKGKFAVFRRAGHCRNCGVCVCNSCCIMWSAKMIPETYNLKKESQVKVCKSCNFLSGAFKKSLLDGDYEEAVALYGSGNINLRTPFPQTSKKKEEIMYPVHCAVEGGNLNIVRWLIDDHFCPIKVIRTASGKKPKRGGPADAPILSSRGRSVLNIALANLHVDILRYLVTHCGVSIYELKDLKGSLRALEAVLLALPEQLDEQRDDMHIARWDDASFEGDEMSVPSSLGADQTLPDDEHTLESKDHHSRRNIDACILCYDNAIDCVMTPCGHQVCCLECSANLSACPVCNVRGEFIKIFRP